MKEVIMPIIKSFFLNNIQVKIYENRQEMGRGAAIEVADRLRKLLAAKEEVNMVFAAAPSQNEFLEALCSQPGIVWERVNAFHMDEYIGLGADAKQSFVHYLNTHVMEKLPFRKFYAIHGDNPDSVAECKRYESLLKDRHVDIVCLGIGENGHIAFNDPHEAYFFDEKLVKIVCLDEKCRRQQINDRCFDRIEDVPKRAITLTVPALAKGDYLFCTVPSKFKAEAVKNTLLGEIRNDYPATALRLHKNIRLYCDIDSAAYLLEPNEQLGLSSRSDIAADPPFANATEFPFYDKKTVV